MTFILLAVIVVLALILLYEFKIKTPNEIVIFEKDGKVKQRTSIFYPRHFSTVIQNDVHSASVEIDSYAKGMIGVFSKISFTAAADFQNLNSLIRIGGTNKNAVSTASKEINLMLQSLVNGFTSKYEIEEISSEKLYQHLQNEIEKTKENFGLEIISLSVQSIEPKDKNISDALKQKEAARILEQTEIANQNARIAAAELKLKADEKISILEHELDLKKFELKKVKEEKESELEFKRVEDELKRKEMELKIERQEIEMIKNNPEILLLSPQIARLAEAGQNLKNAKTVVSFSPNELESGSVWISALQKLINKVAHNNNEQKEIH